MRNQTPPASPGRTALALALALAIAALAGPLAVPAFADGPRVTQDNQPSWRDRGRQGEHWRPEHRFDGYYGAPPVIYVQPQYYQQPGASLNFYFPLFR